MRINNITFSQRHPRLVLPTAVVCLVLPLSLFAVEESVESQSQVTYDQAVSEVALTKTEGVSEWGWFKHSEFIELYQTPTQNQTSCLTFLKRRDVSATAKKVAVYSIVRLPAPDYIAFTEQLLILCKEEAVEVSLFEHMLFMPKEWNTLLGDQYKTQKVSNILSEGKHLPGLSKIADDRIDFIMSGKAKLEFDQWRAASVHSMVNSLNETSWQNMDELLAKDQFLQIYLNPCSYIDRIVRILCDDTISEGRKIAAFYSLLQLPTQDYIQMVRFLYECGKTGLISATVFEHVIHPPLQYNVVLQTQHNSPDVQRLLTEIKSSDLCTSRTRGILEAIILGEAFHELELVKDHIPVRFTQFEGKCSCD